MEDELRRLGLSDMEIKVYLASLECGVAGVHDVAKKAGSSRTYTYEILELLIKKGLVASVIRSGKRYFEAADPEKLLSSLNETESMIRAILPELRNRRVAALGRAGGPKIGVYEGVEGIKAIFDDIILKGDKNVLAYGSITKKKELLHFSCQTFGRRRMEKGIHLTMLTDKTPASVEFQEKDAQKFRETRFVNACFPTLTYIYGDTVAVISLEKELIGVIIEHEAIARSERLIFGLLSQGSESVRDLA